MDKCFNDSRIVPGPTKSCSRRFWSQLALFTALVALLVITGCVTDGSDEPQPAQPTGAARLNSDNQELSAAIPGEASTSGPIAAPSNISNTSVHPPPQFPAAARVTLASPKTADDGLPVTSPSRNAISSRPVTLVVNRSTVPASGPAAASRAINSGQNVLAFKGRPRTSPARRATSSPFVWVGGLLCVLAAPAALLVVLFNRPKESKSAVSNQRTQSNRSKFVLPGAPQPVEPAPGE